MEKTEINKNVEHPTHYNQYDVECIEMMRRIWGDEAVITFCKLNAFKYRMRIGHKDDVNQDMAKEQFYLDYIKNLSSDESDDNQHRDASVYESKFSKKSRTCGNCKMIAAYASCKKGITRWCKLLDKEVSPNEDVCSLFPGSTKKESDKNELPDNWKVMTCGDCEKCVSSKSLVSGAWSVCDLTGLPTKPFSRACKQFKNKK